MPETGTIARHLTIRGLVQGVGYRAAAQAEGARLGLAGWVRNRPDGSVEALVAGPHAVVQAFIVWAHAGPPRAKVTGVDVTPADTPPSDGFVIHRTA